MEDDVVGFHAQQTVEKAVKAVLVLHGIAFPRSHDLDFLLDRGAAIEAVTAAIDGGGPCSASSAQRCVRHMK